MYKFIAVILVVTLVFIVASCSKTPQKALLGKWKDTGKGEEILEFRKNGTLAIYHGDDAKGHVKYEWIGDTKLKIYSGGEEPEIIDISIEGKKLTWNINDPRKRTVYKKTR